MKRRLGFKFSATEFEPISRVLLMWVTTFLSFLKIRDCFLEEMRAYSMIEQILPHLVKAGVTWDSLPKILTLSIASIPTLHYYKGGNFPKSKVESNRHSFSWNHTFSWFKQFCYCFHYPNVMPVVVSKTEMTSNRKNDTI